MSRFAISYLLVLLLGVLPGHAASFIINGYVKDSDGRPMPYARVSVVNSSTATLCNSNGAYQLKVERGQLTLRASMVGYEPEEKALEVDGNRSCDFQLRESAVGLGEVNVYGKSDNRKLKESFFSVNALDVKSLAGSIVNLNDVVDRSSGVKVRRQGGTGSDFDLSINGLGGNAVRYFIDGVPMDARGSAVKLDNLPISAVNRIEVYKGVVPGYLGSDALGGAINIVTNRSKKNYLDVMVGGGSFHTFNVDVNGQFVIPKTKISVRPTFGYNYSKNDYMMHGVKVWDESVRKYVETDRRRFHDDFRSIFAQLEVGVSNVEWADALYVGGSFTKIDKELQTGAVQNIVYGMAERNSKAWSVYGRYNKRWNKLYAHAHISHTWDHSETVDSAKRIYDWNGDWMPSSRNEITGRAPSIRMYKRPLTVVNAGVTYDFDVHHSLALDYMLNRTGNNRTDRIDLDFEPSNDVLYKHITSLTYTQHFFNGRLNNTFFGKSYVNTTRIRMAENPTLTGYNDITPDASKAYWGGGAGLAFRLWEPLQFKLSYERSVRLPLATELLGNGSTIDPNLALKPESSHNGNVGLFGSWFPTPDHSITYEVNGFIRHVNDYIRMSVSEREGRMKYENVPAVQVKGMDAEITYMWKRNLELIFNISYNDSRNLKKYKEDGNPNATYKNRVPNKPWVFGNAMAAYNIYGLLDKTSRLRVNYEFQYVHWYYLNWEAWGAKSSKAVIPTQCVSNLGFTYSWHSDRYSFSAECSNIFNKLTYDNYMLQKPGRSFYAKFRVYIN